jgi:septal ring factor EnvC (AmiA/AmiB activator)
MSPLDLKRLQVEYKEVNAARERQELKICEIQEQIDRIQKSIEASKAKEDELMAKINEAEVST